jgi:hypothetical protein
MSINTMLHRRSLLSWASRGIGSTALLSLLMRDGLVRSEEPAIVANASRSWMHPIPKAKPALAKFHGKSLNGEHPDVFFGQVGLLRKNDWAFQRRGQSGLWVSDLFPHLAGVADELTVIRSMVAETSNHTPATFQENTGFRLNGFPVFGSWASFGLGSESQDLPAFVVIPDPRGVPAGGSINWTNGFLPAQHQGVIVRSQGPPIDDLFPSEVRTADSEERTHRLLAMLNQRHLDVRGDDELAARMRSYEMAARMQRVVPEVTNLYLESEHMHHLYGIDRPETSDFGRACLLSRRMLESGVRFIQLFSGGAFGNPRINWDGHENMFENHSQEALRIDRPIAGLLQDLRQRGMLDDTLVLFTSEFGRTPFAQSASDVVGLGRDHNQFGFSVWMAGAGLKHGFAYGATDEIGMRASENPVTWHDFHATVLHLLGIDHERLTFYHNGIQRRLTDVSGQVLKDVLG